MSIMERQRTRIYVVLCNRLADGLISSNGIISNRLAGEIRYMDNWFRIVQFNYRIGRKNKSVVLP